LAGNKNMKTYAVIVASLLTSFIYAEEAKIIDVDTGKSYSVSSLTNGTKFKIENKTYRLEIKQSESNRIRQKLAGKKITLEVCDMPASQVARMINQFANIQIVFAPNTNSDKAISISMKDGSILKHIELICFQIGAEAEFSEKMVKIISPKKHK